MHNSQSKEKTPPESRPGRAIFDTIAALVLLGISTYMYIGFFHADPRIGTMVKVLLWGVRISFPIAVFALLYLYYGIRTGRVPAAAALLIAGSCVFVALLVYPVVSYLYYGRSFRQNIDQYHPYLQLSPRDYEQRDDDSVDLPLRVFCLGGSTTEFTDKQDRGWPVRLEEHLRGAVPGRRIEVYNLGRQWYTSLHTLINYSVNLRQHRPDVIIVMHAINDLLLNADFCHYSFGEFQEDYRHFHGPLYRLINRPTLWETILRVARSMWYHTPREVITTDRFPGLASFERNLRTLIDLARIDSAKIVLLTQPYLVKDSMTAAEDAALVMLHVEAVGPRKQWGVSSAKNGMERYNASVRKVAEETGVLLVDLEPIVPKSLEYFHDDVHYRNRTYDIIAEYLAKELLESGILR